MINFFKKRENVQSIKAEEKPAKELVEVGSPNPPVELDPESFNTTEKLRENAKNAFEFLKELNGGKSKGSPDQWMYEFDYNEFDGDSEKFGFRVRLLPPMTFDPEDKQIFGNLSVFPKITDAGSQDEFYKDKIKELAQKFSDKGILVRTNFD